MTFKVGKSYTMRNGEKATILAIRSDETPYPLIGYIEGRSFACCWTLDGTYEIGGIGSPYDFMPLMRTLWINVYKDGYCAPHNSEEQAQHARTSPSGTLDPTFSHCITTEIPAKEE